MIRRTITYGLLFIWVFINNKVFTQTETSFRQYQFNALILNPAQAGTNNYSDISLIGTQYWIGIPGAPKTMTLSTNIRLLESFGIGATVISDQTGPAQTSGINLISAYHLKLNKLWKVSAGLKLSAINHSVLTSELLTTEANDPDMARNLSSGLAYNAGFGFLAFSKKMYLGFSVPRVAKIRIEGIDMTNYLDKTAGYVAYAGVNYDFNKNFKIRPNIMTVFGFGGPLGLDLNAILTIKKTFDFGLTYHLKGNVGAILGVNIQDRYYIGYSYAYPLNNLNKVSIQSHEIALRFKFNRKVRTAETPRFFN